MPPLKPYLVNATWRNITDCGHTPHIHIHIDERCIVPTEFAKQVEHPDGAFLGITLSISLTAAPDLIMNDQETDLHFSSRFGGKHVRCLVPYDCIVAIYAKEDLELGLAFEYQPPKEPVEQEAPVRTEKPVLQVVK